LVVTAGSLRGAPVEEVVGPLAMGARAAGSTAQIEIEPDRRLAIRRVLAAAQHDDVVAILGRGARQTLSSGASVGAGPRFDDRQVAREELDLLLAGGAQPARATTRA
jgi:UDP-N-acetylmuramyl tripeptide synthase